MEDPVLAALRVRIILTATPLFLVLFWVFVATAPTPVRIGPALLVTGGLLAVAGAVGLQPRLRGPFPRGPRYWNVVSVAIVAAGVVIAALGPGPWTAFSVSQSFVVLAVIVLALDGRRRAVVAVLHGSAWLGSSWVLNDPGTEELLAGAAFQFGAITVMLLAGRIFADHVGVAAAANEAAARAVLEVELARAQERERLAEALHDHALQLVIAARQDLDDVPGAPAVAHQRLGDAIGALRGLSVTMNDGLVADLTPAVALEHVVAESAGDGRLEVRLDVEPTVDARHTPLLVESTRELLTNVRRHARATAASVTVRVDGDDLELRVEDNGDGVSAQAVAVAADAGHLGIWRLRRHAEAGDGRFELGQRAGGGTVAVLRVRHRAPDVRT